MAFCPHCGKSVAEQAVKCLSCGGELEAKAKAARFKGTMIMQPAAAPAAAAAPAPAAAAPAPAAAPKAGVSTPAPAPAMADPTKAAPSKAKHTMIGTGGGGLGPAMLADFKKAQAAAAASAPPPPAGALPAEDVGPRMTDPALADTARDHASAPAPAMGSGPQDEAEGDASAPRMLAGDPMAEKPAPRREPRPTPRAGDLPNVVPGSSNKPAIVIALIGVLVIAIAGYAVARMMGLLG